MVVVRVRCQASIVLIWDAHTCANVTRCLARLLSVHSVAANGMGAAMRTISRSTPGAQGMGATCVSPLVRYRRSFPNATDWFESVRIAIMYRSYSEQAGKASNRYDIVLRKISIGWSRLAASLLGGNPPKLCRPDLQTKRDNYGLYNKLGKHRRRPARPSLPSVSEPTQPRVTPRESRRPFDQTERNETRRKGGRHPTHANRLRRLIHSAY